MENFQLEFKRSKQEAYDLYFDKVYRKSIWIQIAKAALIVPGVLIFSLLRVAIFGLQFNKGHGISWVNYLLALLIAVILIIPYVKPIWATKKILKDRWKAQFGDKEFCTIRCNFSEDIFRYQVDDVTLEIPWSNATKLRSSEKYVIFESDFPRVQFTLPKASLPMELQSSLKSKII